jgi:DhnA family fructose-bisphosphate aldolase class Ia
MNKAIELGVSYALESGADGIAIPWPGEKSFKTILAMCGDLPIWVKPGDPLLDAQALGTILELGAAGLWLDERVFGLDDPLGSLQAIKALLHDPVGTAGGGAA